MVAGAPNLVMDPRPRDPTATPFPALVARPLRLVAMLAIEGDSIKHHVDHGCGRKEGTG